MFTITYATHVSLEDSNSQHSTKHEAWPDWGTAVIKTNKIWLSCLTGA